MMSSVTRNRITGFSMAAGRRLLFGGAAALTLLAAPMLMAAPAMAQGGDAPQTSCVYKYPSGTMGTGQSIVADYCSKQRFCQTMSERGGTSMAQMGCFGFVPNHVAPASRQR